MQECPRCKSKFSITRHFKLEGDLNIDDYQVTASAIYCPACGVELDSWEALIGYRVVAIYSDGDEVIAAGLLKAVVDDEAIITTPTGDYCYKLEDVFLEE